MDCNEAPKLAVTDWVPDVGRVQAPVPAHAPLHPLKEKPAAGVAFNVTCVPAGKVKVQVVPQSIPVGVLVTVPVPAPARVTVTWSAPEPVKLAATDWAPDVGRMQAAVPVHAPLHPPKEEPAACVALKVT